MYFSPEISSIDKRQSPGQCLPYPWIQFPGHWYKESNSDWPSSLIADGYPSRAVCPESSFYHFRIHHSIGAGSHLRPVLVSRWWFFWRADISHTFPSFVWSKWSQQRRDPFAVEHISNYNTPLEPMTISMHPRIRMLGKTDQVLRW